MAQASEEKLADDSLLAQLRRLQLDPPLAELQNRDAHFLVSFWWLQRDDVERNSTLLYGSLMRRVHDGELANWSLPNPKFQSNNPGSQGSSVPGSKWRVLRTSIIISAGTANAMLDGLVSGSSLANICASLGLPAPPAGAGFRVSASTHAFVPTAYFLARPPSDTTPLPMRGRESPAHVGCYCTRLLATGKGLIPDDLLALLPRILGDLDEETGVGFTQNGFEALGSLEVFSFPGADEKENSRVDSVWRKAGDKGELSITVRPSAQHLEFLIHARSSVLGDIYGDQIAIASGTPPTCRFLFSWQTDGLRIVVWARHSCEESWVLWHEEETHYVRSLGVEMNFNNTNAKVNATWLDELTGSKARDRALALARVSHVGFTNAMLVSYRDDWEKVVEASRTAARKAFPESSGGLFLRNVWDAKLEFATWLKDRMSEKVARILLVDPYFDDQAMDLIARGSGAADEVVVLVCAQARTDEQSEQSPRMPRAERLVTAATQAAPLLKKMKLRILDLRSTSQSSSRLFHDRYLLTFEKSGDVAAGYHLSTSLQSAARVTPLLITPIPSDVLAGVADYVGELLSERPGMGVVQLFPPATPEKIDQESFKEQQKNAVANALAPLARCVFGEDNVPSTLPDVVRFLSECGWWRDDRLHLHLTDENVTTLQCVLGDASPELAARIWNALGESLARDNGTNGARSLVKALSPGLRHAIECYMCILSESAKVDPMDAFFEMPFEKAIRQSAPLVDRYNDMPSTVSWGMHFAGKTLLRYWPSAIVEIVEGDQGKWAIGAARSLVGAIVDASRGTEPALPCMWLGARNPALKAFGAFVLWRSLCRGFLSWPELAESLYAQCSEDQRRVALAYFLVELWGGGARRGVGVREPLPDVETSIVGAFGTSIREPMTQESLHELAAFLQMPLQAFRCESWDRALFARLEERGVLDAKLTFGLWSGVVDEKRRSEPYVGSASEELVEVWGESLARAGQETIRATAQSLKKETERLCPCGKRA